MVIGDHSNLVLPPIPSPGLMTSLLLDKMPSIVVGLLRDPRADHPITQNQRGLTSSDHIPITFNSSTPNSQHLTLPFGFVSVTMGPLFDVGKVYKWTWRPRVRIHRRGCEQIYRSAQVNLSTAVAYSCQEREPWQIGDHKLRLTWIEQFPSN